MGDDGGEEIGTEESGAGEDGRGMASCNEPEENEVREQGSLARE